jgi:aminoglycoside 3-N-acetyltransferase
MSASDQLCADLLALGVRRGGVLLVHSSLRALGFVSGGPKAASVSPEVTSGSPEPASGPQEAIIRGLLQALGPEGTLLMPALSYAHVTPHNPHFDLHRTPSNVGAIPEAFRTRTGTHRSLHPTHSVCAAGPLAASLIKPHAADHTPCGPHSPFHTLSEHGGQILMLGCGLAPNTSMHAIEELVEPPYLFAEPLAYTLIAEGGRATVKTYIPHNFHGLRQRYERVAGILGPSALHRGPVLAGEAWLIEAAALWEAALALLQRDPLAFVEPL